MNRPSKAHVVAGRAGCVQLHVCRQTGTAIGVYYAPAAGLDDDDGQRPWSLVCERHHIILSLPTRTLARIHAADPVGWCAACAEAHARP